MKKTVIRLTLLGCCEEYANQNSSWHEASMEYQPLPTILLTYSLVSATFVSAEIFEVRACLWLSVKFQGWERPGAYKYA